MVTSVSFIPLPKLVETTVVKGRAATGRPALYSGCPTGYSVHKERHGGHHARGTAEPGAALDADAGDCRGRCRLTLNLSTAPDAVYCTCLLMLSLYSNPGLRGRIKGAVGATTVDRPRSVHFPEGLRSRNREGIAPPEN
ncbi:MAG: hypothetical protein KAJ78_08460, partial [Acidobacteria bacterium]|nr:hypothetical protein [Acidobacteriota bacterium]